MSSCLHAPAEHLLSTRLAWFPRLLRTADHDFPFMDGYVLEVSSFTSSTFMVGGPVPVAIDITSDIDYQMLAQDKKAVTSEASCYLNLCPRGKVDMGQEKDLYHTCISSWNASWNCPAI